MHRYFQSTLTGLAAAALVVACGDSTTGRQASRPGITDPSFTLSSGFVGTPVARGNAGAFHIRSKANGYDVEIKAKSNTDIVVANITVTPRGHSGWHSHPGPVLVIVKTGVITFYHANNRNGDNRNGDNRNGDDQKCSRTVYPAGTAFIEVGGDVGLARNEGSIDATVTATFFVPAGAGTRIDQPAPGGNCPS